jgi:hypothetical protein
VSAHRQIDLDGSISACDAAGSALRASGALTKLGPRALERLNDFRVELCVRGRPVGRAGTGTRASWLARTVTKIPVELNLLALLKAGLTAF